MKPSEKLHPYSVLKMRNPVNLVPSIETVPSMKPQHQIALPTWPFMVNVVSDSVSSQAWFWFGPFLDGLLVPHYRHSLAAHCSSSWVCPDYGLARNGFRILPCTFSA